MTTPMILPIPPNGYAGTAAEDGAAQAADFYGEDIWYDMAMADPVTGKADYVITAAGDWAHVTGIDALRQALLRRLVTNPGEWKTNPGYGVGAPQYVKSPDTPASRAELAARIRSQFLLDDRVESISAITISNLDPSGDTDGGLEISVSVVAAGRLQQNAPVVVQIVLAR